MGRLRIGGVVGAGVSIAATHLICQANGGARICGDDPCGMYAGIMSLVLLEPILIPVGVHGAAAPYVGSRGNLEDGMLTVIPAVPITIPALIERASANGRER